MAPTASSPVRVIGFTAAERRAAESSPIPGDGLLHPLALLAIGILIVNDHALKAAWPGVVTGKLSDVARNRVR